MNFLVNTQDYRRDLRRQEYGDERDPGVPVTEATQMVEALRQQGHTVWYMNALNKTHLAND